MPDFNTISESYITSEALTTLLHNVFQYLGRYVNGKLPADPEPQIKIQSTTQETKQLDSLYKRYRAITNKKLKSTQIISFLSSRQPNIKIIPEDSMHVFHILKPASAPNTLAHYEMRQQLSFLSINWSLVNFTYDQKLWDIIIFQLRKDKQLKFDQFKAPEHQLLFYLYRQILLKAKYLLVRIKPGTKIQVRPQTNIYETLDESLSAPSEDFIENDYIGQLMHIEAQCRDLNYPTHKHPVYFQTLFHIVHYCLVNEYHDHLRITQHRLTSPGDLRSLLLLKNVLADFCILAECCPEATLLYSWLRLSGLATESDCKPLSIWIDKLLQLSQKMVTLTKTNKITLYMQKGLVFTDPIAPQTPRQMRFIYERDEDWIQTLFKTRYLQIAKTTQGEIIFPGHLALLREAFDIIRFKLNNPHNLYLMAKYMQLGRAEYAQGKLIYTDECIIYCYHAFTEAMYDQATWSAVDEHDFFAELLLPMLAQLCHDDCACLTPAEKIIFKTQRKSRLGFLPQLFAGYTSLKHRESTSSITSDRAYSGRSVDDSCSSAHQDRPRAQRDSLSSIGSDVSVPPLYRRQYSWEDAANPKQRRISLVEAVVKVQRGCKKALKRSSSSSTLTSSEKLAYFLYLFIIDRLTPDLLISGQTANQRLENFLKDRKLTKYLEKLNISLGDNYAKFLDKTALVNRTRDFFDEDEYLLVGGIKTDSSSDAPDDEIHQDYGDRFRRLSSESSTLSRSGSYHSSSE